MKSQAEERRKNRRSALMRRVEEQQGKSLPELLRERHRALGSFTLVAEEIGVPSATVYYWFRKFDIPLSRYVVPEDAAPEREVEAVAS